MGSALPDVDEAGPWALRWAGRAGFTARGVVYLVVGTLAIRIAFGRGTGEADRQGALREIAGGPFGAAALWLLVAGFASMALWRACSAVSCAGFGRKSGRAGRCLMDAGRATFYAAVSWGTAAFAVGAGGQGDGDSQSRDWTASALALPAGRWLLGAAGVALATAGAGMAVRAVRRRFLRELDTGGMGTWTRRWVTACGVAGNAARGTVFAAAGAFVVTAAVRFDPYRAKGLDDTLRAFAGTRAGPWLLVLVALGLSLFGVFSFASARWRRF
ncbi:DUF1206 domain-containing protein [Kitasatospora sp. NPDC048540]|uniref:DUF1206 domain-containing protein n=1 Tax=unclassified Kitasatospora TaxID=2633591 RepID=UPI000ADBDF53|nr:DUF1206 domain-containing protein [Kitasatospora sp. MBT63]